MYDSFTFESWAITPFDEVIYTYVEKGLFYAHLLLLEVFSDGSNSSRKQFDDKRLPASCNSNAKVTQ